MHKICGIGDDDVLKSVQYAFIASQVLADLVFSIICVGIFAHRLYKLYKLFKIASAPRIYILLYSSSRSTGGGGQKHNHVTNHIITSPGRQPNTDTHRHRQTRRHTHNHIQTDGQTKTRAHTHTQTHNQTPHTETHR